jgi:D-sedoheptulose 7-phosphate isomerase
MQKVDPEQVQALIEAIVSAYQDDRFVFIMGNGGSGANASHLCEDLGKGTLSDFEGQKRLKVVSLTDNTSYILAWANDEGYERIFVEQLRNLAQPGALVIAISGSGNSPNVLRAVEYASANAMTSFAITGYDGGRLAQIADHNLHVPSANMGAVEAVHSVLFHYLVDVLRARFAQT